MNAQQKDFNSQFLMAPRPSLVNSKYLEEFDKLDQKRKAENMSYFIRGALYATFLIAFLLFVILSADS